jgi:hypothetical protein
MNNALLAPLSAATIAVCTMLAAPLAADARPDQETEAKSAETVDKLILRSGRIVEGEILEETETSVRIMVVMAGMSAPATYPHSQILEIKHDVISTPKARKSSKKDDDDDDEFKNSRSDEEADAILYVIEMNETFGVHTSQTPLEDAFEAADKYFGDLDRGGRVPSELRDKNIIVIRLDTQTDPRRGFDGIWRAEDLAPVVEEQIVGKGRRVVIWIENALGGASFMPWVSPEIYFTNDGIMGGIGSLDTFDMGDEMVNEKQISLRLGHAEGFAIKGGYAEIGPPIIRAMARQQNWLCVRWEGGKPIFRAAEPPEGEEHLWQVLTDSGEGEYEDPEETAYKGNDILRINSDLALKLGLADGIADDIDDLAFELGVDASYAEVEDNRANKIMVKWEEDIERAIDNVSRNPNSPGELWIEYGSINVGGTLRERTKLRGQQINILKRIRSIVNRYAEVFDADGTWRANLDVEIASRKAEQNADKNNGRGGGGRGGSGRGGEFR